MVAKTRRSVLQTEILAELKVTPARSITALASAVGSSRPSVSRSLRILREQGLVEQEGRTWFLSKSGNAQVGISVAKLQEAIDDSVHLTGRRLKVLARIGLADMAAASLNHMLASRANDFILDGAADRLTAVGATAIGSMAASAAQAIHDHETAITALKQELPSIHATSGMEDQPMAHGAFRPDLSTEIAALGMDPQSMLSNALGPDLSSISGVRDLATELGITNSGIAEADRRVLQDAGASTAASVWQSIDGARLASGSALVDIGAQVGILGSGVSEASLLANASPESDVLASALRGIGSEATTADSVADEAKSMASVAAVAASSRNLAKLSIVAGADNAGSALANLDHSSARGLANGFASIAEDLAFGVTSMLTAQEDYASFLSNIQVGDTGLGYGVIGRQTSLLAEAMDHIHALQLADIPSASLSINLHEEFSTLPSRLTSVTASLADVFHDQVQRTHHGDFATPTLLAEQMVLSTAPVTHYMGAVRSLVEAELEDVLPPAHRPYRTQLGNARLDAPLKELDPDFPGMRRGAWIALASDNPDRLRHAATSQRDLLTQLLRLLVPSLEQVEDGERGSKMKARVKKAVGNSESSTTFVATLADAVCSYYSLMSKFTHTNQKHQASLQAILVTGEGLIEFILVNSELQVTEV